MTWGAVAGAAIGVVGGAINANQQKKAAKKAAEAGSAGGGGAGAAEAANQQSWYDIERANELNRKNALWAQQQNLVDTTTDFGSTSYETDPVTGKITAKQSLAPEQQKMLEALRGQQATAIGGMESGFNVNNDVMQAMRAQTEPLMQQQRDRENARLAAMGLSTGSGSAWSSAQDVLNRSANDMQQKNILAGFDAWNKEQANNRANLAGLNATESGWAGMAPKLSWSQVAAPNIMQPENMTFEGWMADQELAQRNFDNQAGINAGTTGQIANIVGGLAGNKDVQNTVSGWFKPSSSGGSSDWGYGDLGEYQKQQQQQSSSGFDW